ncbi:MAG: preprotein translocase subunit SecE [Gemmatimonadetes bacterium]|jgi:preprotein translocase subunit SecE|nr:preprotein translocase subunit SecE [Gemmatimonadota bacterium]MBT7861535.1 preprotein translocase subunit SecE [Gemmatimonadota bacterium]
MWEKLTTFLSDVRGEFGRVIWPSRDELVSSTTVVIVFSIAFAIFIGFFDLILSYVRSILISL